MKNRTSLVVDWGWDCYCRVAVIELHTHLFDKGK